jgi:hypothetical protein
VPFRDGEHPEDLAYIEDWTKSKYCRGFMDWQINKGDYVTEQTKISMTLFNMWYVGTTKSQKITLFACDADKAPKYERERRMYPMFEETPTGCVADNISGIEAIGVLYYDFEDLDMSLHMTKMIDGRRAYRIDYHVEVHLGDKSGALIFKVVSNGDEIGKVDIDFNKMEKLANLFVD